MLEPVVAILGSAGLAALLLGGLAYRRGRRRARFKAIADEIGFSWMGADDKAWRRGLAGFRLFAPVNASRAYSFLRGQVRGLPVTLLDYDYGDFINGGFNPYLVLVFEEGPSAPAFWLRPRGSLNGVGAGSTGGAAALAPYAGLARAYVLDTADTGSALSELLAHCERLRGQGRWPSVEGRRGAVIYYEPFRQQPSTEAVRRILADGAAAYTAARAA